MSIICLTKENQKNPWILFEAGALAKGLSASRVCTFLIDLNPEDVRNPLAQFNHTKPTREGLYKLITTLNGRLASQLSLTILGQSFEAHWPKFEGDFKEVLSGHPSKPDQEVPARTDQQLLVEILNNTRSLQHRVSKLESTSARGPASVIQPDLGRNLWESLTDNARAVATAAAEIKKLQFFEKLTIQEMADRLRSLGYTDSVVVEAIKVCSRMEKPQDIDLDVVFGHPR